MSGDIFIVVKTGIGGNVAGIQQGKDQQQSFPPQGTVWSKISMVPRLRNDPINFLT